MEGNHCPVLNKTNRTGPRPGSLSEPDDVLYSSLSLFFYSVGLFNKHVYENVNTIEV